MYATGPSLVRWTFDRRALTVESDVLDASPHTFAHQQQAAARFAATLSLGPSGLARRKARPCSPETVAHTTSPKAAPRPTSSTSLIQTAAAPRTGAGSSGSFTTARRPLGRIRRARRGEHRGARRGHGTHPTTSPMRRPCTWIRPTSRKRSTWNQPELIKVTRQLLLGDPTCFAIVGSRGEAPASGRRRPGCSRRRPSERLRCVVMIVRVLRAVCGAAR